MVHSQAPRSQSILEFLEEEVSLSIERAKELLWLGAVYVDGQRVCDPNTVVGEASDIRVHTEPRRFKIPSLASRIVQKHSDFYVVDKPSGVPTHGLVDNLRENLIAKMSEELGEKLFITHRLDVETSGLLIIACNSEAQARINAKIAAKEIQRFYRARVERPVSLGRHVHYLEQSPKAPKRVSRVERPGWLRCELEVLSCTEIENAQYELEIELFTGRSQQIRAQLADLGAPIVGDARYGSSIRLTDSETESTSISLRADRLIGL
ncbi:MAG TPA: pseudouridine synthase [Bdellovibrionales bacterium]|nr:pseudouridine synthase [Bdellovibrionales bacterium]